MTTSADDITKQLTLTETESNTLFRALLEYRRASQFLKKDTSEAMRAVLDAEIQRIDAVSERINLTFAYSPPPELDEKQHVVRSF